MITPGKILLLVAGVMLTSAAWAGWKLTARSAYETAAYTVERADGHFEIRQYPELLLAATPMNDRRGNDGSFMRLFRYISGANEQDREVAMTTPVFMGQSNDDSPDSMGFVLPATLNQSDAPLPTDSQVELKPRPAGRYAVIRFAGEMNASTRGEAEESLREWMAGQQLSADTPAEAAGYDPPWTPGFLRRNEVLIRLSDEPG